MNHKIRTTIICTTTKERVLLASRKCIHNYFPNRSTLKRWNSSTTSAVMVLAVTEERPKFVVGNTNTIKYATANKGVTIVPTHQDNNTSNTNNNNNNNNSDRRPRLEELRNKLKLEHNWNSSGKTHKTSFKSKIMPSSTTSIKTNKHASINNNNNNNSNNNTINGKGCSAATTNNKTSSTARFMEEESRNVQTLETILKKLRSDERWQVAGIPNNNKSTFLLDTYKRQHTYLRISLSERCNLRCQYCMPPEGVPLQPQSSLLSTPELYRLVDIFRSMGVTKVRLTGGEPLLRSDLVDIVHYISSSSSSSSSSPTMESIGITTNGITLSRKLPDLISAGLTHVNISLDTLMSEDKFLEITRRRGLQKVLQSIYSTCNYLPQVGRVKVNCVVMKGFNDMELRNFILLSKDLPLDVRFIEWMPFNDNGWTANRFFSYESMLQRITSDTIKEGATYVDTTTHKLQSHPNYTHTNNHYIPPIHLERIADSSPNDTTKWYSVPGHLGRVGFITSMSEHFCSTCNRIRLTADGKIKVCLFGNEEVSLRDALRGGFSRQDIELLIGAAVRKKKFALGGHGDMHNIQRDAKNNRPMTLIGG